MTGETDLRTLLRTMSAVLADGLYVFASVTAVTANAVPADISVRMRLEEAEGVTLILLKDDAKAAGLAFEFPCRMITLNVHSSLAAVGFLARITTALAKAGIGVNPVSGFHHDHLFVPDGRERDAMAVLAQVSAGK
ncbi:ACT domain-containing protein [Pacificimonas sp. WHA3]|uniref:ACT domain-containing protein n=1 Tax=Pacificimonas pallii TaxID=2827236 RepID=A0ABS6SCN0_9SPHN|nr:ACT domain-containing protein [Pacificimonas pallii]